MFFKPLAKIIENQTRKTCRQHANDACRLWLDNLVAQGRRIVVPEIADYEAQRELLRANKPNGILRLNRVKAALT